DGVVLFAAEQLALGFMQSAQYFNIGLYEYARVYMRSYPQQPYPRMGADAWPALERIGGFDREWIEKWINLPDIDVAAVAIAHFFMFPERFVAEMPAEFKAYQLIFKGLSL
ncbi:MAG TPA: hypothetical protein PKC76_00005, partial [Saprospiraceae bacterium]|nr:hypothetical protein [Saprospiraceae bacterium]